MVLQGISARSLPILASRELKRPLTILLYGLSARLDAII